MINLPRGLKTFLHNKGRYPLHGSTPINLYNSILTENGGECQVDFVNGKPSVFVSEVEVPMSVQQQLDAAKADTSWIAEWAKELVRKEEPAEVAEVYLPRPTVLGGSYTIEIQECILMPSPWDGIFEFVDQGTGELLAFFTDFHNWLSIIPNPWANSFAAVADARCGEIPYFCIDGVPIMPAVRAVEAGMVASARVPRRTNE